MQQPVIYFLADKERYLIGLSTFPELEAKFYLQQSKINPVSYKLYLLTQPSPWGIADYFYHRISTKEERIAGKKYFQPDIGWKLFNFFWEIKPVEQIVEDKITKLRRLTANQELKIETAGIQIKRKEIENLSFPDQQLCSQVYQLLKGKKLYLSEIRQALRKKGLGNINLNKVLIYLKLLDKLRVEPAVKLKSQELTCQRCGSTNITKEKERENNLNYYCKECILLGEATFKRPLYFIPDLEEKLEFKAVRPQLDFELTFYQEKAAEELRDLWYERYTKGFVWAVCGAGKTEITFKVIAEVLSQGGRVLFAIPRKDVVIELAARLKDAFPGVEVKALHGDSEEKLITADLAAATTHQVIRYYRTFDLVIIDEMDAFPYQGNRMLKEAVKEARKQRGKLIYMTATPRKKELTEIKNNQQSKLIKLPVRYHGYPLPEPENLQVNLRYDRENSTVELPKLVIKKLKLSVNRDLAQVFVFVPSRKLVKVVTKEISSYFPEINGRSWVRGSHSKDNLRKEKREEFMAGEYPIMVSTTIMERGVTVEKANVLVLFADWNYIFNEQTLIQMAGRSGRSAQYPDGKVWFMGNKITPEMRAARGMIKELNKEVRS